MSTPQASPKVRLNPTPPKPSTQAPDAPNGSTTAQNTSAFAQNASITLPKTSTITPPDLSSFSESTQEILKRVNAAKNIDTGSVEWEKAKEQVLREMVSSNDTFATVKSSAVGSNKTNLTSTMHNTALDMTPPSNRARRGPGRPRGSGRGRPASRGIKRSRGSKRKRSDDEDDADVDDTDASESYTPAATVTKSGRNVTKPSQFNPAPEESPTNGAKRRRYSRRNPEVALCLKCQRGHSPANNMIVFCDGCNGAYHQWCHDPHISKEVIDIPEQEWICSRCQSEKELETVPIEMRVSGENLTDEEKTKYLTTLSSKTLASLLLQATKIHPSLPIFAPNTRSFLQSLPSTSAFDTSMITPPISQPPSAASRPLQQPPSSLNPAHRAAGSNSTALSVLSDPIPPIAKEHEDPYADYSNPAGDPPATYPRPGTGPIKIRPTTDPEDLPWLLDENFEVFSHLYDDGSGELVAVDPARRAKQAAKKNGVGVVSGKAEPAVNGGTDDARPSNDTAIQAVDGEQGLI